MGDFEDRGGRLAVQAVQADDLDRLAAQHDLLVVASAAHIGRVVRPAPEKSPYDKPQRRLCCRAWHGVAPLGTEGRHAQKSRRGTARYRDADLSPSTGTSPRCCSRTSPAATSRCSPTCVTTRREGLRADRAGETEGALPGYHERVDPRRSRDPSAGHPAGRVDPHMRADWTQLATAGTRSPSATCIPRRPLMGQARTRLVQCLDVGEAIWRTSASTSCSVRRVARRRAEIVESTSTGPTSCWLHRPRI